MEEKTIEERLKELEKWCGLLESHLVIIDKKLDELKELITKHNKFYGDIEEK